MNKEDNIKSSRKEKRKNDIDIEDKDVVKRKKNTNTNTNVNVNDNKENVSNIDINSNDDDNSSIVNLVDMMGSYAKFSSAVYAFASCDYKMLKDDFLDNQNILEELDKIKNKKEYFKFTEKDIATLSNNVVKYFD